MGYYTSSWSYTIPQIVNCSNFTNVFSIDTTSTNLTLNFTMYAGVSNFTTPLLIDKINIETYLSAIENCWSKNGNVLFIPMGCVYNVLKGISYLIGG
jgi:hypothetical protein